MLIHEEESHPFERVEKTHRLGKVFLVCLLAAILCIQQAGCPTRSFPRSKLAHRNCEINYRNKKIGYNFFAVFCGMQIKAADHDSFPECSLDDSEGLKNFYKYIPHVHKLLRCLRQPDINREDEEDFVVSKSADCCQSRCDVLRAQRARQQSKELNRGCGLNACRHLPYRPFGLYFCIQK